MVMSPRESRTVELRGMRSPESVQNVLLFLGSKKISSTSPTQFGPLLPLYVNLPPFRLCSTSHSETWPSSSLLPHLLYKANHRRLTHVPAPAPACSCIAPGLGDFATPTPSCARSPYHTPLRTIGHMTNLMMVSPRCVVLPDVMRHGRPHAPTAIDRYRYVWVFPRKSLDTCYYLFLFYPDGPVCFLHLHSRRTATRSTSALRRSVSVSLPSHLVLMRSNLISRIMVGP